MTLFTLTRAVRRSAAAALAATLLLPAAVHADVKTQEKSRVQFGGALGRIMNMFGGAATRDGVVSTVALRGNRMLTTNGTTGELVDLAEEKVYRIDFKDRSYKVVTFDEMRRQTEQAMAQAKQRNPQAGSAEPASSGEPQFEVDFAVKATGQTKTVAGLQVSESIATVTVRRKGKTLEQAGGMVLDTHLWQAPEAPGMREMAEFRMKYALKLYGGIMADSGGSMVQAMAMYPMMQDAMKKMAAETQKLSGVTLATDMTFEAVPDPAQAQSQAQSGGGDAPAGMPTSLGGLLGGIGRKMGRQKADQPAADGAAGGGTPGRTMVMSSSSETLQMSTSVTDADVSVPAGFKLKQ